MPDRPFSICPATGCRTLTKGGRCPAHKREDWSRDRLRRGTAHARGYGRKWQGYATAYRKRHPHCVRCGALTELVDHITPVDGPTDPRFWDPTNHQSLCWSCHSRKTTTEDHRGLNTRGRYPTPASTRKRYPKESRHPIGAPPYDTKSGQTERVTSAVWLL